MDMFHSLTFIFLLLWSPCLTAYPGYDQFWIGLTDQNREMYYEWIDGTDVKFTSWNYYEPNNVGEEDCAEVYVPNVSISNL